MKKMNYFLAFLFILVLDLGVCNQNPRTTHNIPWDPRIDNKFTFGHTKHKDVFINDYMEIFCPQYDADESDTLKFVIYNVTRKTYEQCILTKNPQKIYDCDNPTVSMKLTTKFQERSPNPLGFTFQPGRTYYYMAVPINKNSAHEKPCDGVMRLSITVHPRRSHHHSRYFSKPSSSPSTTTTTTTTATTTTTTSTTNKTLYTRVASSGASGKGVKDTQTGDEGGTACSCHTGSLALIIASVVVSFLVKR